VNFNIYLDESTGKKLARVAARSRLSRNALIRKAVQAWLERESRPAWPDAILSFEGIGDFEPFESRRVELRAPARDPLA
jgi:predicted transcriptional regulator